LTVGIEDDAGRIAGESSGCESIDLKYAHWGFSLVRVLHASVAQARLLGMLAAIDISMYPLTGEYRPPIQAFIDRLNTYPQLMVRTNSLATQIFGSLDEIMTVLSVEMARSAAQGPQLVFVMKVLPGLSPPAESPPGEAPAS
jgi:uncharacterized protein YqgV (UPF0045/DUF77 family)